MILYEIDQSIARWGLGRKGATANAAMLTAQFKAQKSLETTVFQEGGVVTRAIGFEPITSGSVDRDKQRAVNLCFYSVFLHIAAYCKMCQKGSKNE